MKQNKTLTRSTAIRPTIAMLILTRSTAIAVIRTRLDGPDTSGLGLRLVKISAIWLLELARNIARHQLYQPLANGMVERLHDNLSRLVFEVT